MTNANPAIHVVKPTTSTLSNAEKKTFDGEASFSF